MEASDRQDCNTAAARPRGRTPLSNIARRLLLALCLPLFAAAPALPAVAAPGQGALIPQLKDPPPNRAKDQAATPPQTASPNIENEGGVEPQPMLPDLRTLPPDDLHIDRMSGGRRFLRLGNVVWNSGLGPLLLQGHPNPAGRQTLVTQRIEYDDGSNNEHLVGAFTWHPSHAHFHFEHFAVYEIWSLTSRGELHQVMSRSEKLSYCLMETDTVDRDNPAYRPHRIHTECDVSVQGIMPGWGDRYRSDLEGQSIEITWLPDGRYALRSTANPGGLLTESSYTNNSATVLFELSLNGQRLRVLGEAQLENCRATGSC